MFPEETHIKILRRIDDMEAESFKLYRKLASLRIGLQDQWRVMPDGTQWSIERQRKSEDEVK